MPKPRRAGSLILKSFLPPMFLIALIPARSSSAGRRRPRPAGSAPLGALVLAAVCNGKLSFKELERVCHASSALTIALVFFIFFSATCFAFVFRSLGGDDIVDALIKSAGLDTGWEILILIMVIVFVLGFFFDWIEITLIVLPVFAPMIASLDFTPHVGLASELESSL